MEHAVESTKQGEHKGAAQSRASNTVVKAQPLHPMLQLQQQAGNQAMQELLRAHVIQAKMAISHPDDPEEREADHVADRIMRSHAGFPVAEPCSCADEGHTCEECQQKQSQPKISRRASTPSVPAHLPRIVSDVLRSPGQPLDPGTRSFMEPRFGRDFSNVRVHTDFTAANSAAAVNALAYTAGRDIVFARGQYAPHSPAGGLLLAHELVHTLQQGNGASSSESPFRLQRAPDDRGSIMDTVSEPAGGCGLCYGEKVGPREAGIAVHKIIQNLMAPGGVEGELPLGKGRVDLAVVSREQKQIEIGEIKPANEGGMDAGIEQIEERLRVLPTLKKYAGYKAVPLKYPVKQPIRFETLAPICFEQPGFCYSQELTVGPPVRGLYLYFCEPSYSELLAGGCHCECKEPKQQKKKDPESPGDTLPGKLLKMGEDLALGLAADALLGVALELSGALAAVVLSPLAAVAALVLGIVYFWDKLKWLGRKIAALANWVWGKITWILDTIKSLAIDLGELAVWLGGKVVWLAEKLAAGAKWVAGKAVAGAKWVGHEVASGAEAVWDWLFGSDPEPVAPTLDLPEIEPTRRCDSVAHDDTIVKIAADLLFATNEWELLPGANAPLTEAAGKILSMLNHRDDRVMIEGYTDNVGGVDYNQGLSERRAQAVADWFDQHHAVPMSIIRTEGFGKTKAQNNDPVGRAKDRRVEIWVTKHGSVENVCR